MLRIGQKELVTVSDDCTLKFWSSVNFKIESQIMTETITCIAATGANKKDMIVAGCHSGNLILISAAAKTKREQISMAHYNLIRVIVTLEALKNKYFVTADVCGIVKVWTSSFKPQQVMEIQQEGAISYNSMIEVTDMLPKRQQYEDTAMIACALKSQKINLILLVPQAGQYQVIKTLKTEMKPTCMIQLSSKHLAIAVGSLKEHSSIEVHDMNKNKLVSTLSQHTDMIDSLLKIEFPSSKTKMQNPYIQWMLSASRDRTIILWKLIDGRIMKRNVISTATSNLNTTTTTTVNNNSNANLMQQSNTQQIQNKQTRKPIQDMQLQQDRQQQQEDDEFNLLDQEQSKEQEQAVVNDRHHHTQQAAVLGQQQQDGVQNILLKDYFYQLETTHKDFIRSMIQLNDNTLLTASEDKTIKIFTIAF